MLDNLCIHQKFIAILLLPPVPRAPALWGR